MKGGGLLQPSAAGPVIDNYIILLLSIDDARVIYEYVSICIMSPVVTCTPGDGEYAVLYVGVTCIIAVTARPC